MSKLLNQTQDKFTIVQNCIFTDARLSFHARGVLCTLISLPNGWNYSIRGLASLVCGEGAANAHGDGWNGITTSIKLLEKCGYLKRILAQNDKGKFDGYDYVLCVPPENPQA